MPEIAQHIIVLLLAGVCLAYCVWQGIRTLRGHRSSIGSCCSTGCAAHESQKKPGERIVFLPVESLQRRK